MLSRLLTLIWWSTRESQRVILVLLRVRADHVIAEPSQGPRKIRQRIIVDQRLTDGTDPVRRNDIARERLPEVLAVGEGGGQRVVDDDRRTGGVDQARKVASVLRRRGVGGGIGQRAGVADPLHIEHEECLVFAVIDLRNAHRPIHYESRLVPAHDAAGAFGRVSGETVGIQFVVAEKLVQRSMKRVGTALQHGVHNRAGAVAVLRIIRVGLDRDLLDGVGRRHKADVDGRRSPLRWRIGDAVQHDLVLAADAFRRHLRRRAVERAAESTRLRSGVQRRVHSRGQIGEHICVAAHDRQVPGFGGVDGLAHGSRAGTELLGFRRDGHAFGEGSHFQLKVRLDLVAGVQFDACVHRLLEAIGGRLLRCRYRAAGMEWCTHRRRSSELWRLRM